MSMLDTERSRRREIWHRVKGYLAVLVSLAVLGTGGYLAFDFVNTNVRGVFSSIVAADYQGSGVKDVEVVVEEGQTATDIGETLVDLDVVASTEAWQAAVSANPEASSIQTGTYRLRTQIPAATALQWLLDPSRRVVQRVTVAEGLRLEQQVEALTATGIPAEEFERALERPEELGLVDFAEGEPAGFLFPDTYDYSDDDTATDLLRQMGERYGTVAEDLDIAGAADDLGVSERDIAIVASIIEKEVFIPEDRPKVARVIYNRLEAGQRLQFDSTVYYALGTYPPDAIPGEAFAPTGPPESPYNTYKVDGLPAGPISAPGRAALEAAIDPAEGDWLYFVTVNLQTGETRFTDSEAEHQRNVEAFNQWCVSNGNPAGC
ncbi:endolytic transglycosylase MltG [Desertihabitans brevis]|uniref:Endolytic murein transglycosylase n=2 Tax=Desertihabitans brevis TaxID=2268447 RepID=A0A367YZ24_9ACTN|nr:endolytic transglycosylase MltG [Desertihabitans brevis]